MSGKNKIDWDSVFSALQKAYPQFQMEHQIMDKYHTFVVIGRFVRLTFCDDDFTNTDQAIEYCKNEIDNSK